MTDVVLTLPVRAGEEAQMFGRFLSNFLEALSGDAAGLDETASAPVLMLRSDPPFEGEELKVLTFQETGVAHAFANGWARIQGAAKALARR